MRAVKTRIEDMLQAIERISRHVQGGRAVFERDEVLQYFVVYHLIVLGEAASKVPDDFRRCYPDVPWDSIRGMRHILVHDYFRVALSVVWNVVENDLPPLKAKLERILEELR